MAENSLSLKVLAGDELATDSFPELPVRLVITGEFAEEDREDHPARVELRMRPDRLADLVRQVKAAQAALAVSERRRAESDSKGVQDERKLATEVAVCSSRPTDTGTLKRVLTALIGETSATDLSA